MIMVTVLPVLMDVKTVLMTQHVYLVQHNSTSQLMTNAPLVITSSQDVKIVTIKTHVIYVMLISTENKS